MDAISFNPSLDLADRVTALENAATAIIAAINALPAPVDTSGLSSQLDAFKTDIDGLSGRLDADEKTLQAISDHLANSSADTVDGIAAEIDHIKTAVNAFHVEVYGGANPNTPFPPVPPADTSGGSST